jgi:hypothetical protein
MHSTWEGSASPALAQHRIFSVCFPFPPRDNYSILSKDISRVRDVNHVRQRPPAKA